MVPVGEAEDVIGKAESVVPAHAELVRQHLGDVLRFACGSMAFLKLMVSVPDRQFLRREDFLIMEALTQVIRAAPKILQRGDLFAVKDAVAAAVTGFGALISAGDPERLAVCVLDGPINVQRDVAERLQRDEIPSVDKLDALIVEDLHQFRADRLRGGNYRRGGLRRVQFLLPVILPVEVVDQTGNEQDADDSCGQQIAD